MSIDKAVKELEKEQFWVVSYKFEKYSIIGVYDKDETNNLGPYQNMTYFIIDENSKKALVIDPGVRGKRGYLVKKILGIKDPTATVSHYHVDHWIGYGPYKNNRICTSQFCIDVLTGKEEEGIVKVFKDGRLNWGHTRQVPQRVLDDLADELPLNPKLFWPISKLKNDFGVEFYELPGQTQGSVYGCMEADGKKILFANDLLIEGNGQLFIEIHYDFPPEGEVIRNHILALKPIFGLSVKTGDKELRGLLKKIANPDVLLLGHGPFDIKRNRDKAVTLILETEFGNNLVSKHTR